MRTILATALAASLAAPGFAAAPATPEDIRDVIYSVADNARRAYSCAEITGGIVAGIAETGIETPELAVTLAFAGHTGAMALASLGVAYVLKGCGEEAK